MTDAAATSNPIDFRDALRGWGPPGIAGFAAVVLGAMLGPPAAAVVVLLWLWVSRTPPQEVGLARPASWVGGLAIGVAIGVALKILMKAVVMQQLGAPDVVHTPVHDYVRTQAGAIDLATYAIYGAGFAEELVFRGFLFERFGKLFGRGTLATGLALVLISVLFGAAHYAQGIAGMENAAITGFVIGLVFLATGRNLYIPMIAHATFDLVAIAIIYFGYEAQVAHLVFK